MGSQQHLCVYYDLAETLDLYLEEKVTSISRFQATGDSQSATADLGKLLLRDWR